MADAFKTCAVDGCNGNAAPSAFGRRGWCCSHYNRFRRHGDPLGGDAGKGELLAWIADHAGHQADGCLPWPYATGDSGYGVVLYEGVQTSASRVMCIAAHGPPPTPEHEAAHSCGRGHEGCVHPGHLRWATTKDNHADKKAHGTENTGERNGGAKLTEAQAREILSLRGVMTGAEIAAQYRISKQQVSAIHTGRRWSILAPSPETPKPAPPSRVAALREPELMI